MAQRKLTNKTCLSSDLAGTVTHRSGPMACKLSSSDHMQRTQMSSRSAADPSQMSAVLKAAGVFERPAHEKTADSSGWAKCATLCQVVGTP